MALIKCECGQEISDQALKCPHCGKERTSVKEPVTVSKEMGPKKKTGLRILLGVLAGIVVLAIIIAIGPSLLHKLVLLENQEGRHRITLTKLCLAETDFSRGVLGDPLNIIMTIYKDGNPVFKQSLYGYRGERTPKRPVVFEIDYSKNSRYLLKLEEQSIIASAGGWTYGAKEDIKGFWFFNRRVTFGEGSWLEFSDEKVR